MIHGSMSLGVAGIVSLISMAVVFVVLLSLYLIITAFGKIISRSGDKAVSAAAPAPAAAPAAAPKQDDAELIAVLSAAIAEYERGRRNPFIRNRRDLD